jgi:hypothetical protein
MFFVYELKNTIHAVSEDNIKMLNELTNSDAGYKLLGKVENVESLVKPGFGGLEVQGLNAAVVEKLANAPVLDKKKNRK